LRAEGGGRRARGASNTAEADIDRYGLITSSRLLSRTIFGVKAFIAILLLLAPLAFANGEAMEEGALPAGTWE